MRKPFLCICENKDADQLCSNCAADQRLCFRYIDSLSISVQSLFYLNPKFRASSHVLGLYSRFVSDLVGNLEDRFSHNEAQLATCRCWFCWTIPSTTL